MSSTKTPKVMLVDDSDTDLFINETMIKYAQLSNDIISFSSSTKALEHLKLVSKDSASFSEIPDIIFLDINMPLLNGFEFIREYQSLPALVKNKCQIILLSSTFNSNDIQKGADDSHVIGLIAKPLTIESLHEMLGTEQS
jgi:CheY-like chemotaxis protein